MLTLHAPAKINLTLEVLSRRNDGYHEVRSIMQTIDLTDTLTLSASDDIRFHSNHQELVGTDNLVVRAASLLKEKTGCARGASLTLTKRIPVASGLGGGSSDAAATLKGLADMWELGLSQDGLASLASALGSDVPFFLYGGTALAEGRGERITPLPPLPSSWVVAMVPSLPPMPNKTAQLYSRLEKDDFTSGQPTDKAKDCLLRGEPIPQDAMCNVFERVALESFPSLPDYWEQFEAAGATRVRLAGSGPALFTLEAERARAEAILNRLQAKGLRCYLARTLGEK